MIDMDKWKIIVKQQIDAQFNAMLTKLLDQKKLRPDIKLHVFQGDVQESLAQEIE
jgi:hypothetical protein